MQTWPTLIAVFGAMRMVANKELLLQLTQILNNEMPTLEPWLWIRNLWMPDSPFAAALPDMNTLRQIPGDQWIEWFNGLDQANLPALIRDLSLTADSFSQANLAATRQPRVGTVQEPGVIFQNAAYASAIAVKPGWTFNLLITQFSLINTYNGLLILPILSAVSQLAMTKIVGTNQQQPAAQGQGAGAGKFMQYFFPIFSMVICLSYSAAFALYWVAGNLASMGQTYAINKYLDNKEKAAAAMAGEGTVK